jgi:E3 ubiquitin-protein ligase RNF144
MSISSSPSGWGSDELRLLAGASSRPTPRSKQPVKLDRETAVLVRQIQVQEIDQALARRRRNRDLDHATAVIIRSIQLADLDRILQLDARGNDTSGDENGGTEGLQETAQPEAENNQTNQRECMSCHDAQLPFDMTTLACECRFCHECARMMVHIGVRDNETANCLHGPIDITSIEDILRNGLAQQYRRGEIERSALNPVYCVRQDCAMFLGSGEGLREIQCQRCRTTTCARCNTKAHVGDCNDDAGVREVLRVADENQWQRCPGCRTMVERPSGCNNVR